LAKRSFHLFGADAEAICEALQRPGRRFVAIKSVEQQDIQALHRRRSLAVERRTGQVSQIRGLLLEYGIEIAQGRANVQRRLPEIWEDAGNGLSGRFRAELPGLYEALQHLNGRVAHDDAQIEQIAQASEPTRKRMTIPGIGAKGATALVSAVGEDPSLLQNGRGLAAWLGLVPRQHATGGKERLLGISTRGDSYLRQRLIHGARAVLRHTDRKDDAHSRWATAEDWPRIYTDGHGWVLRPSVLIRENPWLILQGKRDGAAVAGGEVGGGGVEVGQTGGAGEQGAAVGFSPDWAYVSATGPCAGALFLAGRSIP
jgi:hypothetical protein